MDIPRNGHRVQVIARTDGTITTHEHIGQSWTDTTDGHTLGWIEPHWGDGEIAALNAAIDSGRLDTTDTFGGCLLDRIPTDILAGHA